MNTTIPTGYTDRHDPAIWNTGHVFLWSKVFKVWIDCDVRLTIRSDETVTEAFEADFGCPMDNDHAVYFVCTDCTDADYCAACRGRGD